jgi:hypothetical protein
MAILSNRRPARTLKPAAGSVTVLRPVGTVNETTGEVSINGKPYYLTCLESGFRLTGYDAREGAVTTYDLPADLSSCDCPDAVYNAGRPGGCKHRKAMQALRSAGKLPGAADLCPWCRERREKCGCTDHDTAA